MVVVFGLFASIVMFVAAGASVRADRRAHLESVAVEQFNALRVALHAQVQEVHSVRALFRASNEVTRAEFLAFADELLNDNSTMQALEWIPRVGASERKAYEDRARADGLPGYSFRELDASGELVPAADRPEYFPVYYVEPLVGNEIALGFDLASNPVRRVALDRARQTRVTTATPRVTLVQESGMQYGVLLVSPLFHRSGDLEGFVLGVLRVGDLLRSSLSSSQNRGTDVSLFDATDEDGPVLLARVSGGQSVGMRDAEPDRADEGVRSAGLDMADRRWLVQCRLMPEAVSARASRIPALVLLMGLLSTTALAALLVSRSNAERNRRVHERELVHLARVATAGELVASLAHELNQPLCAIVLNAQAARRMATAPDSRTESIQDTLDRIVEDGERAGATIEHLREFLRKGTVERRPVHMSEVVREAVEMLSGYRRSSDSIRLQIDPGLPPVLADPVQLHQVVLNLVVNGLESMEEAGQTHRRLDVRVVREEPGRVTTVVADAGKGLGSLTEEELFSPFFTTKSQGMGIGLSISRSIVESHGGTLRARSLEGGGAEFSFSLPVAEGV